MLAMVEGRIGVFCTIIVTDQGSILYTAGGQGIYAIAVFIENENRTNNVNLKNLYVNVI